MQDKKENEAKKIENDEKINKSINKRTKIIKFSLFCIFLILNFLIFQISSFPDFSDLSNFGFSQECKTKIQFFVLQTVILFIIFVFLGLFYLIFQIF